MKPSGSMRLRWMPVEAHRRAILPVLGGISGSNKTIFIGWRPLLMTTVTKVWREEGFEGDHFLSAAVC